MESLIGLLNNRCVKFKGSFEECYVAVDQGLQALLPRNFFFGVIVIEQFQCEGLLLEFFTEYWQSLRFWRNNRWEAGEEMFTRMLGTLAYFALL